MISKSSAQKYGNNRRNELAVFVEKAQPNYGAKKITDRSGDDQNKRSNAIKSDVTKVEVPQKRPNASAIERKWRAENWVKPEEANEVTGKSTKSAQNVDEPSNQWNYESNHLAEQLQQIALEEIKTGEKREQEPSSRHQQPKFKPKPPKPRQSRIERLVDASSEDESMTDSLNLDDDGDYVLDTYIRSAADLTDGPDQAETLIDLFSGTDRSNVGILVIDEGEEEAIWETFGENQESDPEWNSEEEDENGV